MMPQRAMRPCNKPGCINLTNRTYCDEHKPIRQPIQRDKDKEREYNKQRGSAASRGYDSKWRAYRIEFLKRNPKCVRCGSPATVVDHVLPHKGNKGLFWTRFNHQALCTVCHDRKTATEDGGFGRKG